MSHITDLIAAGDRLFSKRENLLSFWQDIAENFNPQGADFTTRQTLGDDYASNLMTSYPLIVARELTDTFSSMLRPSDKEWATMYVDGLKDHEAKTWLERATKLQRRAMYDRPAQFVVATKEGDRDFGLYGQAVISVEWMRKQRHLLYRAWHLRDVAWADGLSGEVECVHRKWDTPTAYELARLFGESRLHDKVRQQLQAGKDPYCEIKCRHVVVPADMYHGDDKFRTPLVSIYIDVENEHVIEVTGQKVNPYVIPRWHRVKGTAYATSPAVTCALPEARMLQAMAFTLMEAGEKYARPPLLATAGAIIRDDVNVMAGGITWVQEQYDERQGKALRPLDQDKSGMPIGMELQQRSEIMLRQAFYLDKLDLPQRAPEMTAYEVGQRVQQYIRNALPLFEPVEVDYNGGLCERTFEVLATAGEFGTPDTFPMALRGENVEFKFTSPLREAMEKQKGGIFMEAAGLISQAIALDPSSGTVMDASEALRDTLAGIGVPTEWTRSKESVAAAAEADAQQAQAQQMLDGLTQASGVVKNLSGLQPVAA